MLACSNFYHYDKSFHNHNPVFSQAMTLPTAGRDNSHNYSWAFNRASFATKVCQHSSRISIIQKPISYTTHIMSASKQLTQSTSQYSPDHCTICLEPFTNRISIQPCNHEFDLICIQAGSVKGQLSLPNVPTAAPSSRTLTINHSLLLQDSKIPPIQTALSSLPKL
jgi:hypothetical protein